MLLMHIRAVRPGHTLAQPVFHPYRQDITLLERGYVLSERLLSRLRSIGVPYLWIELDGLQDVQSRMNPQIVEKHAGLCQALDQAIQNIGSRAAIPMSVSYYQQSVEQILIEIVEDPHHEVMTHQLAVCSARLAGHLANCCYLSLLLGAHMSGYLLQQRRHSRARASENTQRLGIGALMHDLGKLQLPDELRGVCVLDEKASLQEYQAHTTIGFELLQGHVPPAAANMALHHHQRWDGTGFPPRFDRASRTVRPPLSGEGIHIFSRVLAVIDAFDHLLCRDGQFMPSIVALAELRSPRFAGWFDPQVVEALNRLIPPFLEGSTVTLSDGSEAVVVANHEEAPCKPTVRRLEGQLGIGRVRFTSGDIDLRLQPDLQIVACGDLDVRPYLFDLTPAVA